MKKISEEKYFNYIFFLYLLIPFCLITGPALSDLSVILIDLIFFIYIFKYKKYKLFKKNFFYFFLFFYSILILSSLFSNDIQLSLKSAIPYIRFGIFILAVNYMFENYLNLEFLLNKLYKILILILFILLIDSTYQVIYHENIFGFKIDHTLRVSSVFGSELIMGGFVMRIAMLLIAILIFLKKNKYLFFLIIPISYLLIIYSGERTAFYLFSIFNLILFIKFNIYKNQKSNLKIFLISIVIILIFFKSPFFKRIFVMTFSQIKIEQKEQYKIVAFTPTHQELYLTAFNIFKKYPLFGSGLKTFRTECNNKNYSQSELGCSTHPHNFYMQILSEVGIFAFIIFVIAYLYIFKFILKQLNISQSSNLQKFEYVLYLSFFIILFPIAPSGNFFNNWLSIMIFYSAGILTALTRYKKQV
jgi:O-antigen ligase